MNRYTLAALRILTAAAAGMLAGYLLAFWLAI